MPALDLMLSKKIAGLEAQSRLRRLRDIVPQEAAYVLRDGKRLLNFSSNDYLGLSRHPLVVEAAQQAAQKYGAGAGASRLVTGNHPEFAALEQALAGYKNCEAALVFGSGYMTNLGVISALMGRSDLIVADKLVHSCILDGALLSGAKLLRFAHNDVAHCERLLAEHRGAYQHCLVVTETIFSMDGDVAPLAALRELCDRNNAWLMADDAHGTGQTLATRLDVQVGTLSKALGAYGGYVCGSQLLVNYLASAARSVIFTTGLPPAVVAAAHAALAVAQAEPELCALPLQRARQFTGALGLPDAQSPIVPLLLGEEQAALDAALQLEDEGFLVGAIRPPTVPEGASRLRFTFSALHGEKDVERLVAAIKRARIPVVATAGAVAEQQVRVSCNADAGA